jgi:hypothetical protein
VEAAPTPPSAERVSEFFGRGRQLPLPLALQEGIGTAEERRQLASAVSELRGLQLARGKEELGGVDTEQWEARGFSRHQMEFKLAAAERAMQEAVEPSVPSGADRAMDEELERPGRRGRLRPSRILRAVGKIREVLASIKSLSKWLEALDEVVAMVGELAKNRLGPRLE